MNTDLTAPLTEEELHSFQQKLLTQLERQMSRYTSGESSSLPLEIAQELLTSICFLLKIDLEHPSQRWRLLLHGDLEEALQEGIRQTQEQVQWGRELWEALCQNLLPVTNRAMRDTLQNMGAFWKGYDCRLFAHEIPCSIDYPLAIPVPETHLGVHYVNHYLQRLTAENRFLSQFDTNDQLSLLRRYCPDYEGLVVNLFEPVAANALALCWLGQPFGSLILSAPLRRELEERLLSLSRREIEAQFAQTIDEAPLPQGIKTYWTRYSRELAARIVAVRDFGGLRGIFL